MSTSLNSRVARFEADTALAHQLVHASSGTIQTESGELRVFAQLQADIEAGLNAELVQANAAQSMLAAELSAISAATDADAAEAARDAALLSNGVFSDTAAGLSGTSIGGYFNVPAADDAEHLVLYQATAEGAVEVKRYPSAAALDAAKATASAVQLAMTSLAADLIRTQTIVIEHHAFT